MSSTSKNNRNNWTADEELELASCIFACTTKKQAWKEASKKLGRTECACFAKYYDKRDHIDSLVSDMLEATTLPEKEEKQSPTLKLVKSVTDKHPGISTKLFIDRESERVVWEREIINDDGNPSIKQTDKIYI